MANLNTAEILATQDMNGTAWNYVYDLNTYAGYHKKSFKHIHWELVEWDMFVQMNVAVQTNGPILYILLYSYEWDFHSYADHMLTSGEQN